MTPILRRWRSTCRTCWPQVRPDLVLYDAGVDPHKDDLLGKLALSDAGLVPARLDYVLATCLAARIPVACVIGGGYSQRHRRPGAAPLAGASRRQAKSLRSI